MKHQNEIMRWHNTTLIAPLLNVYGRSSRGSLFVFFFLTSGINIPAPRALVTRLDQKKYMDPTQQSFSAFGGFRAMS